MSHFVFVPATGAADAGPDVVRQTTMALARVDERLRAERSSLADAVVVTIYLKKPADFAAMNDAYRQAWQGTRPTRTTVVTDLLTTGALVEIAAVGVPSGSERRVVHPSSWRPSPNPYSYAIRTGDTLFLSGLVARNPKDNSVAGGDMGAQTRAVLENARAILEAAGMTHAHVVSSRVFITDTTGFQAMNEAYRSFFPANPPARRRFCSRASTSARFPACRAIPERS